MTRGQSAIDYLMTYGWAILVVVVAGVVIWRMGIFEIGSSMPTTGSGFHQLKPILATCKMSEGAWNPAQNWNGFQCGFANTFKMPITIMNMNITVDGKYCHYTRVTILPEIVEGQSSHLFKSCTSDEGGCAEVPACTDLGGGACTTTLNGLIIKPESVFWVTAHTQFTNNDRYCKDINPGQTYDAFVDMTYDMSIGGKTVTKHTSGYIHGTQE